MNADHELRRKRTQVHLDADPLAYFAAELPGAAGAVELLVARALEVRAAVLAPK